MGVNPFALTEQDYERLERESYITREYADANGLWRGDSISVANAINRPPTAREDMSGIVFDYYHPFTLLLRERVARLDRPIGKMKYVGPAGRSNMFYIPAGLKREWMLDVSIPVVFCEGEKKSVALWRIACELMTTDKPPFIVLGLRGVWGWKGTTGNIDLPDGGHERAKGPLNDFDYFAWAGRDVTIFFDSNIHSPNERTRASIRHAKSGLADYLHYTESAKVYFADMTLDHFERGINGPDNLAAIDGPDAVLEVLEDRQPAIKPVKEKRKPMTDDERRARAEFWRKESKTPEALASDVLGAKAARYVLQLLAEVGFTDEAKLLLIAWEALAQGCDALDYHYGELYELLYKCDGSEFEQTAEGRSLKSSCRKKICDRIARFEAEQERIKITFAYHIAGHLDEMDNPVPSHVDLYSRQLVAEALIIAEETPGYGRAKKETRAKAIRVLVEEKTGVAYIKKPPIRKSRNKQISDGLKRVEGNLLATLERMDLRGDSDWYKWSQVCEALPSGLIEYIKAQGVKEYLKNQSGVLPSEEIEDTPPESDDFPPSQSRPGTQQNGDFGVSYKSPASDADSTDDFARFEKMRTKPAVDVNAWAKTCAQSQAAFDTMQWLRTRAPDAFNPAIYARPQDHPDYEPEYERRFNLLFAEFVAECNEGREVSDLGPQESPSLVVTDEMIAEAFDTQAETMREAETMQGGGRIINGVQFGGVNEDGSINFIKSAASEAQRHASNVRVWREEMSWRWARMRSGRLPDPLPTVAPEDVPAEVFEEYQELLEAMSHYEPTRDDRGKPLKPTAPLSQVLDEMDEIDFGKEVH